MPSFSSEKLPEFITSAHTLLNELSLTCFQRNEKLQLNIAPYTTIIQGSAFYKNFKKYLPEAYKSNSTVVFNDVSSILESAIQKDEDLDEHILNKTQLCRKIVDAFEQYLQPNTHDNHDDKEPDQYSCTYEYTY